ncbi:MAG: carbohydrate binding family 9 domain-containing protein [Bacteroidales bacterium]|nr:carbohydrate binding family 9 domain-containing protein [Bacteroidales bacterium]
MRHIIFFLLLLTGTGFLHQVSASDPEKAKSEINAVRIETPLNLSGKLDDPAWLKALPVELNYEAMPGENTPARLRTVAMVLYDQDNIYIGFRCYDSIPGNIRAHLTDRDKIFSDDYVIVTIDTYNDYQRGFEFAVNPYGIQGDLLLMGMGSEDPSYDMVWQSAAERNGEGWTAEMAIPLKSISFSPSETQNWTISLLRCVPRNNRYLLTWTPIDRNNPSYLAQGGILTGLEGIKPGFSLDLMPYTMIQQSGTKSNPAEPSSPMDRGSLKARFGGGIQYSPGPNISLNAVINPDFSQIESDADQVSVNTTFALYYPEKRPFFMSGMDLLQTPMYYSRTINNPSFATKVNGKAGKLSYIALGAYDRNSGITVPGEEQSNTVESESGSYVGVGRARYDLGNENFIGALWLSRNFENAHNYVGGLDWNFKFWKNWYWQGELFLSDTKEINDTVLFKSDRSFGSTGHNAGFNGEKYLGTGMHLALRREGRNYSFSLVQNNFSPTYQTYNGMFPEVNGRTTYMQHSYTIHPNKKVIKSASIFEYTSLMYNYDGLFKEFVIQPGFSLTTIGQTRLNASYMVLNRERFRGVFFTGIKRSTFNLRSAPLKGLVLAVNGQAGRFIYRTTSPELGKGYNITASLELEPTSRLKTSFSWTTARLNDIEQNIEFYKGHILRNITTFQFTKKLFMREITQYNTFSETFSIYPLLSYKFNAFTMFCAGMTQDMLNYDQEDYTFKTSGYQYFVKLQYLFSK